jgi:hypothetical protein
MIYLMKVNVYHALTLSVIGGLAFSEISFATYNVLNLLGITPSVVTVTAIGWEVFNFQIVSECVGIIVAWLLYKLNLGFSHVSVPPHDPKRKFTKEEKVILSINCIAALIVASLMFWVLDYSILGLWIIQILDLVALVLLLYLASKKEYSI